MRESNRHVVWDIYSEVLFELAEADDKLEEIMEDMECVKNVFRSEREFAAVVGAQTIKGDQKAQIIRRVFGGKVNDLTLNFISVLARRNRLTFLTGISERYTKLIDTYRRRQLVEVTVAGKLDAEEIEKLKTDLSEAIHSEVKLSLHVDPEIIGGIVIKKGDMVIDNTVRSALEKAAERIKNLKLKTGRGKKDN